MFVDGSIVLEAASPSWDQVKRLGV